MGNQSFDSGLVRRMQGNFPTKKASHPFGFMAAQVAFWPPNPHNFTATSDVKAALRSFMSFDFWHSLLPLPLPLFSWRLALVPG